MRMLQHLMPEADEVELDKVIDAAIDRYLPRKQARKQKGQIIYGNI